jgi:hypothetical protein
MRHRGIILFVILFFFAHVTFAQYYDTGQEPASVKWMQIKTPHFTVIYPQKYDSAGIVYAKALDEAYSKLISLFPERKFKIPVVIHNYTTQSNGYVAWAPRRMEIYPSPEQNSIPLSPEKQIALHELTHVFQMESLNQGFTKGVSLLLGEQFTGVVSALLPLWLLEGDAVFAESVLSESGRGRSPSFLKEFKSLTVEKPILYKYDKIINGSYRDYIPDHYQSGYQMVTWSLAKYDSLIWNRVLDNTAKEPFALNPVNISLWHNYRLTKKKLYNEAFDSLKTIWTKDVSADNGLYYETLNPEKKGNYIDYLSPVFAGNDSIIAIKTSLSEPPSFVLINPEKKTEERIHTPGQVYPKYISYGNGKLVWVETQPDPRWENRDYSVIKMLDLKNHVTTRLTRKSRYLSASVSPDGKWISAIENTINNTNNLVILDAVNGSVQESVHAPENVYLEHPQWAGKGDKLTVIFIAAAGEGIMSYTFANRKWEILIDAGKEDLQSSFLRNDSLFFISSLSGTENVYLKTSDNKISSVTRSKFGANDLCLYGGKIFFSDYSSSGNNICSTTLSETPLSVNKNKSSSSFLINRFDIGTKIPTDKTATIYKPEPYRKWQHLVKVHSWMPFYADIEEVKSDPTSVRPGFSIMSQNQLSTLISTIGYEYTSEKNNVFHSRVTWKGLYPVFNSQLDYGNDPLIDQGGENVGNPSVIKPGIKFSNTVSIPLVYSSGKFSEYIRPSFTSDYRNKYVYLKDKGSYDYGQNILSGRFYLSNYYRYAFRDIYPKWAQTIDLNYTFAPFDKNIYGSEVTIKSSFYFPGFLPNNGIKIRIEKEKQISSKYLFGNKITFPRGYKNLYAKDIEFLSIDYVMPLIYPDFNLSSLLYLKRIRSGLFYDYARGPGNTIYQNTSHGLMALNSNSNIKSLKSSGFELMADFHVLRIPFMISCGVQTAWKEFTDTPSYTLLFSIDLFGMSIGRNPM